MTARTLKMIVGLGLMLAFGACKKDSVTPDHHETATPAATITFASPTAGGTYKPGDVIPIRCTITGQNTLHGCHIMVYDNEAEKVLYYAEVHEHSSSINLDQSWTNTAETETTLDVTVTCTLDHDGNSVGKTTTINSKP